MPINFAVKLAATVAIEALQVGLQATRHTYGPRLSETQVTTADYGTLLAQFLGARRFAGQIVWSRDLEVVQETHKVKGGGKQTTESALWTAGIAFANCRGGPPVEKILKIWMDETLAYDATGTGPVSYASSLGFDLASVMRIYLGTEDQMPDPAYVDYCEERYGPNSATAFRGYPMLVFDRLPLDNFGNRPPQIQILAVTASLPHFPYDQIEDINAKGLYAGGGTWVACYTEGAGTIDWFDAPTRTLIGTSIVDNFVGTPTTLALAADGTGYAYGNFFVSLGDVRKSLWTVPAGGGAPARADFDAPFFFIGPTRVFDVDGARVTLGGAPAGSTGYISGLGHIPDAKTGRDFALHGDGSVWGIFQPDSASTNITLKRLRDGHTVSFAGLVTRTQPGDATFCCVSSTGRFFVVSDDKWYIVSDNDDGTGTIEASGDWGGRQTLNIPVSRPEATSFWAFDDEISLIDGSTIRTIDESDWVFEDTDWRFYDAVNDAMWATPEFEDHQTIRYLDRVAADGVTLGDIVSKMCDTAGLEDRDTSLLTQLVAGYSWTRGDVKSQMEPVLDIHDVDACPDDFTIRFKPRGSAPSGTILTRDLAKNGDSPRYKMVEGQDTDLPRLLRINFADTTFDQEGNNILSPLPIDTVDSQRDVTIDGGTYADMPSGMQQKGDRYMRRTWNGKDTVELSLTAQELAIKPGDVKALDLDGIVWAAKLEKQTFVGSTRMDCVFRRDGESLATLNSSTTGPEMEGRDPQVIVFPAPVNGFVVDAPFRWDSDEDVRPLLYAGAGSYGGLTFPGASIWERTGAGDSAAYDTLFASTRVGATWGRCSETLADIASPWLWDRGNTLEVTLESGSLTSVTEADINEDPTLNLILVGRPGAWEYLNFTTATLLSPRTYQISGFKRGRRGTEWACGGHEVGEVWVLASSLDVEEMGADQVGGDLSFKAQAIGRSIEAAAPIDIDPFTGATLKPYAPARLAWSTDGTDLFGRIVRRTRIGGTWNGSTIPLGEASEAYEVDIYHGSTFKRTITVSGTNEFTYTAAQIAADGNSVGSPPPADVYQMSAAVGRGFALAA